MPSPPSEIDWLLHGSTVALNAVLRAERDGRLITTKGFRDVLELGRGNRPSVYDWTYVPPEPLVPRHLRREVPERLTADGVELVPLDEASLDREVDALVAAGVDAIAVSFLHSYANTSHERAATARIRERHPRVFVTASADVAAEWREFERTQTAVLNAFVQPTFGTYLAELAYRLRDAGHERSIAIMQSNGGVVDACRAGSLPVRTLMSGPAGGAIGARELLAELGVRDGICADVGGTSFDVCLIRDGEIQERTEASIAGRPVLTPIFDIVSVGAGGGSIAWIDETGAPRVGPASAGGAPGPACFGLGGEEPTVTDAQLVLGRLNAAGFLGARMRLDAEAAARAVEEVIAAPLGIDLEHAAEGIVVLAEATMAQATPTCGIRGSCGAIWRRSSRRAARAPPACAGCARSTAPRPCAARWTASSPAPRRPSGDGSRRSPTARTPPACRSTATVWTRTPAPSSACKCG
jgi:N-methylhydantoinase A